MAADREFTERPLTDDERRLLEREDAADATTIRLQPTEVE